MQWLPLLVVVVFGIELSSQEAAAKDDKLFPKRMISEGETQNISESFGFHSKSLGTKSYISVYRKAQEDEEL